MPVGRVSPRAESIFEQGWLAGTLTPPDNFMRYVIIRDDDTNASTPIECLETLYRPWLDRGMPINLALIPEVSLSAHRADGRKEQFLFNTNGGTSRTLPIAENNNLVRYLLENRGYHIVQHGLHHDYLEFDRESSPELATRIERG